MPGGWQASTVCGGSIPCSPLVHRFSMLSAGLPQSPYSCSGWEFLLRLGRDGRLLMCGCWRSDVCEELYLPKIV
jgi:hypothetical protein